MKDRPELDALVKRSIEAFNSMTPEQKTEHLRQQKISWVYGELAIDNPNITREQIEQRLVQSGAISSALSDIAAAERAKIVAWLRSRSGTVGMVKTYEALAAAIERGEHEG